MIAACKRRHYWSRRWSSGNGGDDGVSEARRDAKQPVSSSTRPPPREGSDGPTARPATRRLGEAVTETADRPTARSPARTAPAGPATLLDGAPGGGAVNDVGRVARTGVQQRLDKAPRWPSGIDQRVDDWGHASGQRGRGSQTPRSRAIVSDRRPRWTAAPTTACGRRRVRQAAAAGGRARPRGKAHAPPRRRFCSTGPDRHFSRAIATGNRDRGGALVTPRLGFS